MKQVNNYRHWRLSSYFVISHQSKPLTSSSIWLVLLNALLWIHFLPRMQIAIAKKCFVVRLHDRPVRMHILICAGARTMSFELRTSICQLLDTECETFILFITSSDCCLVCFLNLSKVLKRCTFWNLIHFRTKKRKTFELWRKCHRPCCHRAFTKRSTYVDANLIYFFSYKKCK